MKKFKIITKEEKVIDSVICDRCNKEFSDVVELQEFLFIKRFCGFGSIFWDEKFTEVDLCQKCQERLFGDFIISYWKEEKIMVEVLSFICLSIIIFVGIVSIYKDVITEPHVLKTCFWMLIITGSVFYYIPTILKIMRQWSKK